MSPRNELVTNGIRATLDDRNEKLGFKIRDAELHKIPYMAVIGPKEAEANQVSLRRRKEGDLGHPDDCRYRGAPLERDSDHTHHALMPIQLRRSSAQHRSLLTKANSTRVSMKKSLRLRCVSLAATESRSASCILSKALELARVKRISISWKLPQAATPPVVRIMDFGKFKYGVAKERQVVAQEIRFFATLKTIRLSPSTDDHDLLDQGANGSHVSSKKARKLKFPSGFAVA
jgi:hypothetical protein